MKKKVALMLAIAAALGAAAMSAEAQAKPRLAILPFTGGNAEDAESIAEFFSFEDEINRVFTPVPRTRAVENLMREQEFQRSGLTDSDTIAELGKQLNADFVLAGHIATLGDSELLLITIINVEALQQIAGDYREYQRIERVVDELPAMARRIAAAATRKTSGLPRLAVLPFNVLSSGVNQRDAELLAQLLATEMANAGVYAVFPRTRAIEKVMEEHHIERSGMTDAESVKVIGEAVNAQYVLSANVRKLGADNYFSASVLHVVEGSQGKGTREKYQNVRDGLSLMPKLAATLNGTAFASAPAQKPMPANMARIAGGAFTMGSHESEAERKNDETRHSVTISKPFYIGKYEVTQKEWVEVMGSNPSRFKGDDLPVECVSWYDAIEYCNRRSEREGLTPAYTIDKTRSDGNNTNGSDNVKWVVAWNRDADGYRLPTEAEWELACRAGTATPFYTGNSITTNHANYDGNYPYNNNAKGESRGKTWAVGSGTPNPWGLYDMSGNVEEWCWDWYGSYGSGAQIDPVGVVGGVERVVRGGTWRYGARYVRSAIRNDGAPSGRYDNVGLRVVRP